MMPSWPVRVPKANVLQVESEAAKASALIRFRPGASGSVRTADQDGFGSALKKSVLRQRRVVPAIRTSSLAGHFSKRAMNGTLSSAGTGGIASVERPSFI